MISNSVLIVINMAAQRSTLSSLSYINLCRHSERGKNVRKTRGSGRGGKSSLNTCSSLPDFYSNSILSLLKMG